METSTDVPITGDANVAPKPDMPSGRRFSETAIAELNELLTHYPEKKAAMLPALWIAQREYGGYLPPEAIQEVADRLERPYSEAEGVATFYTMYNIRPRGKHHLEVCTCLTCAVTGAYDVMHKLEHLLGVGPGETTKDGQFTLAEVECLDWCGWGTVVQVGDTYFGNVTPDNVPSLIEQLRSSPKHSPTDLADAVVKVHLPGGGDKMPTDNADVTVGKGLFSEKTVGY